MKKICFPYKCFLVLAALLSVGKLPAQQNADTLYQPDIVSKAYPENNGSLIYIDQGHQNFHTKDGRFSPFAKLLKQDGYKVEGFEGKFDPKKLRGIKVLVISNALSENARPPFTVPTDSAFSEEEISAIEDWVRKGGSLFLIADHMPFAGASATLGKAFGFGFYDGFLLDEHNRGIFDFSRNNKMLASNFITNGRNKAESVDTIRTFTGQGFSLPDGAVSILELTSGYQILLPDTMWVFDENTKRMSAEGLSQGAVLNYGKGRVAVFGEAAMFTAQLAGATQTRVGMNAAEADENFQLLLNIIHWLDRLYDEDKTNGEKKP
ncbi:MAG: DUF4350 domain-containing protein [Saprospiraceae bacterium]|nr:DUF4350 domain-containing protein [Saprospiraceae bacterium]MCB9325428.1 DUF4350 domain-containing protein [Lewinellaceae bacterium]